LRKESGFEVTDRILIYLNGSDQVKKAVEAFEDHLLQETLADKWFWEEKSNIQIQNVICGDDESCKLGLEKV
jgi:isoleucyl-tRNA synthetase